MVFIIYNYHINNY